MYSVPGGRCLATECEASRVAALADDGAEVNRSLGLASDAEDVALCERRVDERKGRN